MRDILLLVFTSEYVEFLRGWPEQIAYIFIAVCCWGSIVVHLFKTKHATLHKEGNADHFVCGDIRVWGKLVIFGGASGLSFGIPHYLLMEKFHLMGWFRDLWSGFIYLQFMLSCVQLALLTLYIIIYPSKNWWRFLKAHLKGCGWVSAQSPVGFVLYVVQQLIKSDRGKVPFWLTRDVETALVYVFSLWYSPILGICLFLSVVATIRRKKFSILIPIIWWIDQDHAEDEDSTVSK